MNLDDDAKLNRLFQEQAPDYIDDSGFTARVMASLPRRRRTVLTRRDLLVGGAALLSCGIFAVSAKPLTGLLMDTLGHLSSNGVSQNLLGASLPFSAILVVLIVASGLVAAWALAGRGRD